MPDQYFALYENNLLRAVFYVSEGNVWWRNASPNTLDFKVINQDDFQKLDKGILDSRQIPPKPTSPQQR